jgi:RimJ/RimL family protein N-acetyltransferase
MKIEPVVLEGARVRLEPLALEHHAPLCAVGLDAELWRWTTTHVSTPDEMRRYVETALQEQREGKSLPFATIDKLSSRVVGCTRFGNIDIVNRHVEIGWTWIGREFQRTHVNTEAKYLMLSYAFEKLGCIRVSLKTDALNEKSRRAILRIGAKEEGTLRNHIITSSGRIRDTVYFSIIDREWEQVKRDLEAKLFNR